MNILYIHTHDSGRFWQPYGCAVSMPHLQDFAEQSITFRQAYCANPTCSPSRAALMTGMTAHESGMLGLAHRGFSLADSQKTMPAWFSAHGFETVLCGVQHEAAQDEDLAYDRLLPSTPWIGVTQDYIAWDERNADLVCQYLKEPHDCPFFLSFGMFNTHRPYPDHRRKGLNPDFIQVPYTVPDTAENRADMADYYCSAMAADDCMGRVLEALKSAGLWEDTIVLITTDHGVAWPFMKCCLYDGGIGVAMLLRYPHLEKPGSVCDQLVSHIDIFPTLCELTGVEKPNWLQGVSLLPVITRGEAVHQAIFAEVNYHAAYEPMRCIRTDRYKLILRFDDYCGVVAPNIDASPSKEALNAVGYMDAVLPREELYDLLLDPAEKQNLIGQKEYRHVYEELLSSLQQWMKETNDPLLTSRWRILPPPGAKVNNRRGYDPKEREYEVW